MESARLNLINRGVIRTIDKALDQTWDQVRDANIEKRERANLEKTGRDLIDRAVSRMKSSDRERYVNQTNENGDPTRGHFASPDEAKSLISKAAHSGNLAPTPADIAAAEPLHIKVHHPEVAAGVGQQAMAQINNLRNNGKRGK
jgi:hypothetical protein